MKNRPGATGLTNDIMTYVRYNAREISQLPHPSEEWLVRDTTTTYDLTSNIQTLHAKGIVKRVGSVYREEAGGYIGRWKTDGKIYDLATDIVKSHEQNAVFPCGHNSIQNERGVDGVTCGVCGTVYAKSEVSN